MTPGAIVKWVGLAIMATGVISSWISLWHLAPGGSRSRAYLSRIFQTRTDYTPFGWRLSVWGRALTVIGLGTAAFGVMALGGE